MTLSGDNLSRYEDFEREILDRLPLEARHVPRSETSEYDALLEEPFSTTPPLVLDSGRISLEAETPLELKTCKRWIRDTHSDGDRRRGQYKINESTHTKLVEARGAYIFVVLDEDSGEILAGRAIVAEGLPAVPFHASGKKYSSDRATVSWPRVVPKAEVGDP